MLASSIELRKIYYKKQTPSAAINIVVRSTRLQLSHKYAIDKDLYVYDYSIAWVSIDSIRIGLPFRVDPTRFGLGSVPGRSLI